VTEPFDWWTADAIAEATRCPIENVVEHWPRIFAQLGLCGIQRPNVGLGVIGTTAIESASNFSPVREGCYLGEPEPAESHRKQLAYYPYYGRGELQLTHENNYRLYGQKAADLWGMDPNLAAFDLVTHPDHALDPELAAAVLALYFRDTRALPTANYPEGYTLTQACDDQDWLWVRILVYGGSDVAGATRIANIATDLGPPGGSVTVPETLPTYDAQCPPIAQNDDWSCAPTSCRWALTAYGRHPAESWLEASMLEEGIVTRTYGLMDASGEQLGRWISRHYGEFGYAGAHDASVQFNDVAHEAQKREHPLMMGGRAWGAGGHWTGVRGFDGERLLLANPAPGYGGITQTMSREQFAHVGPFSMVRLVHPAAESGGAVPVPPTDPSDPFAQWRHGIGTGLLDMMAADQTQPAQRASTWLPLGATPSDVETCYGANGTLYSWLLTVGAGYRYRPSA
jgi:hypothetical protein